MFTGSISGTTLTVTAITLGSLRVGQTIYGDWDCFRNQDHCFGVRSGIYGNLHGQQFTDGWKRVDADGNYGKSRLVPFQFSTDQGAFLEFSEGIVRIWEAATEGDWSLGLALDVPTALNYSAATSYSSGDATLLGPFWVIPHVIAGTGGVLFIASPYGGADSGAANISFSVNATDSLSVTATGTSPNQGINIALANTTASNNAATAIQAAVRALVSLNSPTSNFVDLSQWTVTPDFTYFVSPWITLLPRLFS